MLVKVTVSVGSRTLPLEQLTDMRIRLPIEELARRIGSRLEGIRCPLHKRGAANVRIHVDAQGSPDLRYDSCCAQLGEQIGKALG